MEQQQSSCASDDTRSAMRAVVVGATGATGRQVVRTLLDRNWHVTVISRRPYEQVTDTPPPSSETFTQIISSLTQEDIPTLTESLHSHDVVFNCLGTTRGQAGSAEAFVNVEVGLTTVIAEVATAAGIRHASVVSAEGANKDMWVPTTLIHPLLYMRTLGEKEAAMLSAPFQSVTIFRPGMLNRLTGDRGMENLVNSIMPTMTLRVDALALAMVTDAEQHVTAARVQGSETVMTVAAGETPSVTYVSGNHAIRAAAASATRAV